MKAKVFDRPQAKNKGMAWCCILLFIIWISISYMIIIFKDYPKWENTLILFPMLIPIIGYEACMVSTRKTRIYRDNNGNIDLVSPRTYFAKENIPSLSIILGSPWFIKKYRIKFFSYTGHRVIIETWNGNRIDAPLNEIDVVITDKSKGHYHYVYLLKYKDEKLKFAHNHNLFEDEEINDMNNILSNAHSVSSSKLVKITDFLSDILLFKTISKPVGELIMNSSLSLLGRYVDKDDTIVDTHGVVEDESDIKSVKLDMFEEALGITIEQKTTDFEIRKFVRYLKKGSIGYSETNIEHFLLDSTDDGRQILFEAYENNVDCAYRENGLPLLKNSSLLMITYPLELKYRMLKVNEDNLESVIMFTEFIIYIMLCILIFRFDGLAWFWNIFICLFLGIILTFTVFDSILTRLTKGYKIINSKVKDDRIRIVKSMGQCNYIAMTEEIDDSKEVKTYRIVKWLSLIASIVLIAEVYLLFFN